MFGKPSKSSAMHGDASRTVPTIVGPEMTVNGNLDSEGDLHVAGKVHGDIRVKTLIVDKDAVIRGEITAEQVRICGQVTGCIRAREVTLAATAHVLGDVHHDVLSIEAGALLDGHCKRRDGAKSASPRDKIATAGEGPRPVALTLAESGGGAGPMAGRPPVAARAAGGTL